MDIAEVWAAYMSVLQDRAPVTAASVRPPRPATDLEAAERATTPWTAELREFFSLHDGQHIPVGVDYHVGTLLPDLELLTLDGVHYEHQSHLEMLHSIEDLGEEWPAAIKTQRAGETAYKFLAPYVPFGRDGSTGSCYVDTRDGPQRGCVRFFAADAADEGQPAFDSLTDYLDSIRRSVQQGTQHSSLIPTVRDGALVLGLGLGLATTRRIAAAAGPATPISANRFSPVAGVGHRRPVGP
ncbi:SMI1/KNR4 family protein [Rhodococcus sp. G-MC3]|uniref:SMI1/KNR4 family protein n=1 Tax=Rhodococcus sp. G-MC3 TaxID=3046209 RepID=UPI0024B966F8|nr:SMI1/KNR4 family protein [Rhodococcus sp. G-MC3]MDJ0396414.1 SMI1/KNR4 family protein [Rhodococcus sp. G-MC3]